MRRPLLVASHWPGRAVRLVPPLDPAANALHPDRPRPVRFLQEPEPIETVALLPDQPPVTFTWRGVRHRVRRVDGPERIDGEWWRGIAELRDYYRVEDDAGGRFWLYRAGLYPPTGSRAGSCMGSSDEPVRRAAGHQQFLLPARRLPSRGAVRGARLGLGALAIADRNSLAGIVRAFRAARESGVRLVVGCRLDLEDGVRLVYPTDRPPTPSLPAAVARQKPRRQRRLRARLVRSRRPWRGPIGGPPARQADEKPAQRLRRLRGDFGDRAYLALTLRRRPNDAVRLQELSAMARASRVPTVATNDVLYHVPARRILQDVVTCIREGCTIDDAGFRRERYADRHLKPPDEMARLFARYPDAVARTLEIAERCRFSLDELRYQYPDEVRDPGLTPQQTLEQARPGRAPPGAIPTACPTRCVRSSRTNSADREARLRAVFPDRDSIVRFARSKDILCQGRGSRRQLGRLLRARHHLDRSRRDRPAVRALRQRRSAASRPTSTSISSTSGARRSSSGSTTPMAATARRCCATVIRYRARGAVRDVGKALGPDEDVTGALASPGLGLERGRRRAEARRGTEPQPADRRLRLTLDLSRELIGVPRHLSQHPGGFVLTQDRLDELVPIEPAAMDDRRSSNGTRTTSTRCAFMKVDRAGPRHARLHAPAPSICSPSTAACASTSRPSRPRTRRPTR